ncbi:MAG: hypothetical protein JJU33_01895 [Phycisphaerales bacterium]|nr:hypothetical protein [Phycisphaerales bacterium]
MREPESSGNCMNALGMIVGLSVPISEDDISVLIEAINILDEESVAYETPGWEFLFHFVVQNIDRFDCTAATIHFGRFIALSKWTAMQKASIVRALVLSASDIDTPEACLRTILYGSGVEDNRLLIDEALSAAKQRSDGDYGVLLSVVERATDLERMEDEADGGDPSPAGDP